MKYNYYHEYILWRKDSSLDYFDNDNCKRIENYSSILCHLNGEKILQILLKIVNLY